MHGDRDRTAVSIEDVLALSPLQQGLYSLSQLTDGENGADPYVIAMAADITGAVDAELLRRCAAAMLVRHPNLRASFSPTPPVASASRCRSSPTGSTCRGGTSPRPPTRSRRSRPTSAGVRSTLAHGPAIRFLLVEMPERHWRLVVVAHHIVIDGWSLPLFVGELITLYRSGGDADALPPPPRPYRDYIGWLAGRDPETSRALWRDTPRRAGRSDAADTGADGGRAAARACRGAPSSNLDSHATGQLADAARARGVTVNTLVQMAWATILSAFTDRSDVVFGVTVSGRPGELAGVETMVGLFINTVPLRVRLDPAERVGAQCLALQREAAELRDHSYLTHSELRSLGGIGEMFDTLLVYENFPPGGLVGSGRVHRRRRDVPARGAGEPLALPGHHRRAPDRRPTHRARRDDRRGARADDPGIARPAGADHRAGPDHIAGTAACATSRYCSTARRTPSATPSAPADAGGVHTGSPRSRGTRLASTALTWDGGELTYRELDEAADRLAAALVARGVRTETPVADPAFPRTRLRGRDARCAQGGRRDRAAGPRDARRTRRDIVRQTGATVVVDDALLVSTADADHDRTTGPSPHTRTRPPTSCSPPAPPGKPKGVIGTHDALLAYADDHARNVLRPAATRLGRPLCVAHAWSFTFDAAWQPLAALLDGHAVHIVGDDVQRDAEALVEAISRYGVDLIDTTPSMFAQLQAAGLLSTVPLAVLALGGEAIDIPAWQAIRDECARTGMAAYNCYGPTETTVEAVVAAIDRHDQPCDRGTHRLDDGLRARLVAASGARRCRGRVVPGRRATHARLPRPTGGDVGPVRRRPVRAGLADVPHR